LDVGSLSHAGNHITTCDGRARLERDAHISHDSL
jgi:hypothetical protein